MKKTVFEQATALTQRLIGWRRDFHRYPETAWTEFRTATLIADELTRLGYAVEVGAAVINETAMMGVPAADVLERHMQRAVAQGANPVQIEAMRGGKTGVVATLRGNRPGPVLALRFDIDANEATEAQDEQHRPWREGFASCNDGAMHACGHDAHAAIGLGVATLLASCSASFGGTLKLVFQPAEEGVRGAKAMVEAGVVDDVDWLLGMHIGFLADREGLLICGTDGFLATTKLDALFRGIPAHAGAAPQEGRNALLAAANAALNLHAISRHGDGVSRINVGVLEAGKGRNVIAERAVLKLETRGATSEIDRYMRTEALRLIQGAAQMYGVSVAVEEVGGAAGGKSDAAVMTRLRQAALHHELFDDVQDFGSLGASEDFTCFLERVQQRGGQGGYAMIGIDRAAGHHDGRFDFQETVLARATALLAIAALDFLV